MPKLSSTRDYFSQRASFWRDVYSSAQVERAIYATRQAKALALADALRLPRAAQVLEIGCGAGMNAVELVRRGYTVCATDLVEDMVTMTRRLLHDERTAGRVSLNCCDAEALPFGGETFHLVMGLAVLEWVRSPARMLAEIMRVVRPGGCVILSATNSWGIGRLLDPRLNPCLEPLKSWAETTFPDRECAVRAHTYSIRKVNRLLKDAGLVKLDSLTSGYGPFTFLKRKLFPGRAGVRLHEVMQNLADRGMPLLGSLGYTYVVAARKPAREVRRPTPAAEREEYVSAR